MRFFCVCVLGERGAGEWRKMSEEEGITWPFLEYAWNHPSRRWSGRSSQQQQQRRQKWDGTTDVSLIGPNPLGLGLGLAPRVPIFAPTLIFP